MPNHGSVKTALESLADKPGRKLLITAGPTCEDIDAVRYITNRSTGRMGIVLAGVAADAGWNVLLVLGPTSLEAPDGVDCVRVRSAQEMCDAVMGALKWCDALVMTAAVADYTPLEPFSGKIKKSDGELTLRLKRTADILATVAASPIREGKKVVGFALEPEINIEEGMRKLQRKKLDAIVVNTTASFGADSSNACILHAAGDMQELGVVSKLELAGKIIAGL